MKTASKDTKERRYREWVAERAQEHQEQGERQMRADIREPDDEPSVEDYARWIGR
jgi:hypothetical protein